MWQSKAALYHEGSTQSDAEVWLMEFFQLCIWHMNVYKPPYSRRLHGGGGAYLSQVETMAATITPHTVTLKKNTS